MPNPERELLELKYNLPLSFNDIEILQLALQKYKEHLKLLTPGLTLSRSEVLRAFNLPHDDTDVSVNLDNYIALQYADAVSLYNRLTGLVGYDTLEGGQIDDAKTS